MQPALKVENLTKTYKNGPTALKGISLEVMPGDFLALLGPNGAGKSTLIGIISSLVSKSSGHVSLFGHDLDKEPGIVKSALGLVPQEFNFNQFEKVQDIVLNQAGYYGVLRQDAFERCEWLLTSLGLWDKKNVQARNLSGGMKRRLMIARALIHKPRLLILDEPTAGVDIELRRTLWEFVRKINEQGTTIILTTHYLEEAEAHCKNIAIINLGKIIVNSSMAELLKRLDTETFILYLDREVDESELAGSGLEHYELIDAHSLEIEVFAEQNLTEIVQKLAVKSIQVTGLRNKFNRLEELFIKLTQTEAS